jgi:hypothetical protein
MNLNTGPDLGSLVGSCDLLIQRSEFLTRRAFVDVLSLRPPRLSKIVPVGC